MQLLAGLFNKKDKHHVDKNPMNAPPNFDQVPLLDPTRDKTSQQEPFQSYQSTSLSGSSSSSDDESVGDGLHGGGQEHQTTALQSFISLIKGYIGVGLLSLPWAISQLGILPGIVSIFVLSYWSSYNCWTLVRIKRYIEHQRGRVPDDDQALLEPAHQDANDDEEEDRVSEAGSTHTSASNITYPDLGEWAYGGMFKSYVRACICTQQIAICTVFLSFIGENLNALLKEMPLDFGFWETHAGVMTVVLPLCMSLSFIPSLKGLAPVMAAGSLLVILTLALLTVVGLKEWPHRPEPEDLPTFDLTAAPLAMCGILYSYEGINLILPVESAMKHPKHFGPTFASAMFIVAAIMAAFGCFCVYAFGDVTNGSITAFLIHHYKDEPSLRWWLLTANATISISVLLTYPLHMFPAIELLGPVWARFTGADDDNANKQRDKEKDLTGFDPMPAIGEHDEYDKDDEPQNNQEPVQSSSGFTGLLKTATSSLGIDEDDTASVISSIREFPNQFLPEMVLPGDTPQLRAVLVLLTYSIAVIVPNVQSLVSLAGALAGSSSALIIPPILELAWLEHLEHGGSDDPSTSKHATRLVHRTASTSPPSARALDSMGTSSVPVKTPTKYWSSRIRCYVLFVAGVIFLILGTYDSLADIIAIYSGNDPDQNHAIKSHTPGHDAPSA